MRTFTSFLSVRLLKGGVRASGDSHEHGAGVCCRGLRQADGRGAGGGRWLREAGGALAPESAPCGRGGVRAPEPPCIPRGMWRGNATTEGHGSPWNVQRGLSEYRCAARGSSAERRGLCQRHERKCRSPRQPTSADTGPGPREEAGPAGGRLLPIPCAPWEEAGGQWPAAAGCPEKSFPVTRESERAARIRPYLANRKRERGNGTESIQ